MHQGNDLCKNVMIVVLFVHGARRQTRTLGRTLRMSCKQDNGCIRVYKTSGTTQTAFRMTHAGSRRNSRLEGCVSRDVPLVPAAPLEQTRNARRARVSIVAMIHRTKLNIVRMRAEREQWSSCPSLSNGVQAGIRCRLIGAINRIPHGVSLSPARPICTVWLFACPAK